MRPRSDRPVWVAPVLLAEMVSPGSAEKLARPLEDSTGRALGLAWVCAEAKPVAAPPVEHLDLQESAALRRLDGADWDSALGLEPQAVAVNLPDW